MDFIESYFDHLHSNLSVFAHLVSENTTDKLDDC